MFPRHFFLISYLATPKPLLGHWRGDSLNHSMCIIPWACLALLRVGFLDFFVFVFVIIFEERGKNFLSLPSQIEKNLSHKNW